MTTKSFTRVDFCKLLLCGPLYVMLTLLVIEAALSAGTTYLVIQAGKDVANDVFVLSSLLWILLAQATSYVVGAISWLFAERAGFGAFGRYMHRFAKTNRGQPTLLSDRHQREVTEPFLTNESFQIYFELMYEVESVLRLFLSLVFTAIVLGMEIDGSLPITYAIVFVVCVGLQYRMRYISANAYLENQRRTNRMTAHSYTAWDNVFSGNAYSYRLWNREFKLRLRTALRAQIRAIMIREGMSSAFGILSLAIVFAGIVFAAYNANHDTAILVALATTIPRQIDLSHTVLGLAEGGNDLIAIWSRIGGAVDHFALQPDSKFDKRIKPPKLVLTENEKTLDVRSAADAIDAVRSRATGRINVRGGNGSGKSSLLALLKRELGNKAFYWPTTDRLAFEFAAHARDAAYAKTFSTKKEEEESDGEHSDAPDAKKLGYSAGEWQISTLREIVEKTNARYYLLDEWDANLDDNNRAVAEALMNQLASRARVVEISHRDAKTRSAR